MNHDKFFEALYDELVAPDNSNELLLKEMEEAVFDMSIPYRDSTAFRKALQYIEKTDPDLYEELIQTEYNEMSGF
jgi:hypothetical protein